MLFWGVRSGENAYSQNLDKTDRDRLHQEVRTPKRHGKKNRLRGLTKLDTPRK